MTDKHPTIYTALNQSKTAVALSDGAAVLLEKADSYLEINDQEHSEKAGEFRARLNKQIKDLDKERQNMTEGARKTVLMINDTFKAVMEPMKAKLALVDTGIRGWFKKLEEQRWAEERAEAERVRLAKEEAAKTAKAAKDAGLEPPEPPPTMVAPVVEEVAKSIQGSHGSTTGMRDNWKYRLTDIKLVPETYQVAPADRLNKSVLNALARSQKGKAEVPGIEFYNEPTVASRVM